MHPRFLELETDEVAISDFVAARNQRTADALCDARFAQDEAIAARILEDPDRLNGVSRRGGWLYTFRQTTDNPRGLWLRLPEHSDPRPDADWDVVFDVDRFCQETGEIWHWRGAVTAEFDPMRVMLRLSLGGSDRCRHLEFDCTTKAPMHGGFDLPPDRGDVAWVDADTLLCSTALDGAATSSGWPGEVRRLSRGQSETPVIFRAEASDLLVRPYVIPRESGPPLICVSRYLEIGKEQVYLLESDAPPRLLPSPPDTLVWHNATHFAYIVNEQGGVPGSLVLGRISDGVVQTICTPGARHSILAYSLLFLRDWLIWIETKNLRREVRAISLTEGDGAPLSLTLPETAESVWVQHHDATGLAGDGTLQLQLTGFLCPPVSYLFGMDEGPGAIAWRLLRRENASFDASGLEVSLLDAPSDDGTLVPYHLVQPKHRSAERDQPVLLYGYGGFGHAVEPGYDRLLGSLWLAAGGAYALAHIRGGAEFGPEWHLAAKGAGRRKAYEDFGAVARNLEARAISRPEKIACHGHSNGGLLCGVMLTRYPERFGAVWASVGVFDMTRFHKFPAGRAWIDEYGDPDDPEALEWLLAYSPLHRIAPAAEVSYPPCLIDTNANDDRVDPSHARRMAAVLEAEGHSPWFFEHGDGGHGGGGATRARAKEQALGYRFLKASLDL
ncbi:MAG: prolyl oligopeptidase family serine peptidase [Pseudomonadota bacterium]